MHQLLRIGTVVCTVVAGLTFYTIVLGTSWTFVVGRIKSPRTKGVAPDRRARSWADLSGWQNRDRSWGVVVALLGAPSIADRTQPFVDLAERRVDWFELRIEAMRWSHADRVLVDIAHDLTTGFEPEDDREACPAQRVAPVDLVADLDHRDDLVRGAVSLGR